MTNYQPIGGIQHTITQFIMHKNFNEDTFSHDIAIILVNPSFDLLNPKVKIATLNLDINCKTSKNILYVLKKATTKGMINKYI